MSADNGIYVLNLADQSRVIHAQAIDNLWWSFTTFQTQDGLVPTRVYEYFSGADPLTKAEAQAKAFEMEEEIMQSDFPVLEYGIASFNLPMTWKELLEASAEHAAKEVRALTNRMTAKPKDTRWASDLKRLESLLAETA